MSSCQERQPHQIHTHSPRKTRGSQGGALRPPMVAARALPVGWKGVASAAGVGAPRVSCQHAGLLVEVGPAVAAPSPAAETTVAFGGGGCVSGVLASLLCLCAIVHAVGGSTSLTAPIAGAAACRRRTAAAVAAADRGSGDGGKVLASLLHHGAVVHVVGGSATLMAPAARAASVDGGPPLRRRTAAATAGRRHRGSGSGY